MPLVASQPAPADKTRINRPKMKKGMERTNVSPQPRQPAPRPAEVYGRLRHLHPVRHGNDVLDVAGQVAGPLLQFIRFGAPAQKNNPLINSDMRVDEPTGGFKDALETLVDLLVAGDRLDIDLRRRGENLFRGGRRQILQRTVALRALRHDWRGQRI